MANGGIPLCGCDRGVWIVNGVDGFFAKDPDGKQMAYDRKNKDFIHLRKLTEEEAIELRIRWCDEDAILF